MSSNRKEISKVIYNDRFGYAVAYYTPHMRDPGLEIIERSKRIVLPKTKKYKPEPTRLWKLRETPSEFLKRKDLERKIEDIHDTCEKAKDLFKKSRDYDYNRHEMLFPAYKNAIHSRTVEETIDNVNHIYEKYLSKSRPSKEDDEAVGGDAKDSEIKTSEPLIRNIHQVCEHKISKRREDAVNDIKKYCDSIDKMYERIGALSRGFEDKKREGSDENSIL